jgi:hypothetical protein
VWRKGFIKDDEVLHTSDSKDNLYEGIIQTQDHTSFKSFSLDGPHNYADYKNDL